MQLGALNFVADVVKIFKEDFKALPFRIYDACMPLEFYLHFSSAADRDLFRGTTFEDDMGIGNNYNLVDFWNDSIYRWGHEGHYCASTRINYDAYSFIKRWLLILGSDWGEGKRRFNSYFKNNPIISNFVPHMYRMFRFFYRKLR